MAVAPTGAVIFDLDGVLTDTAELHYQAWRELADAHGLAFDRELNERLRGVSRVESLKLLLQGRDVETATFEAWLAEKNAAYVAALATLGPGDVLDGVRNLVDALRTRGLALAVGSASKNARDVLDRLALTSLFDALVDGNDVAEAKPDPAVFMEAARRLGVEPEHCVVIEDAAAGVDAARRAGMAVVGIGPPERVGGADLVYARTADIDPDDVGALIATVCR